MEHNDEKEQWREIIYPDIIMPGYMVSDRGRIKNTKTDYILNPYLEKRGYYAVKLPTILKTDDGRCKFKHFTIHQLVLMNFTTEISKIYDKRFIVNHIDGDKTHSVLTNLEWVTYQGNNIHAVEHGLSLSCEDSTTAKIDNATVHSICKLFEQGKTYKEVRLELGLPDTKYIKQLLIRIRTGKQWKLISSQYNFVKGPKLRKHDEEVVEAVCELIEQGYSNKEIISKLLSVYNDKSGYKFVDFIRKRQCYKDISEKYSWWK